MWNLKSKTDRKREYIGGCQALGVGGRGETLIKRNKLSMIRFISSRDLMGSMVMTANNTVLCT